MALEVELVPAASARAYSFGFPFPGAWALLFPDPVGLLRSGATPLPRPGVETPKPKPGGDGAEGVEAPPPPPPPPWPRSVLKSLVHAAWGMLREEFSLSITDGPPKRWQPV